VILPVDWLDQSAAKRKPTFASGGLGGYEKKQVEIYIPLGIDTVNVEQAGRNCHK
jgi:hypothetical protein